MTDKEKLKRYMLFMGYLYDSAGGWNEFVESFDSAEDAESYAKEHIDRMDWYQVVDKTDGEKVINWVIEEP